MNAFTLSPTFPFRARARCRNFVAGESLAQHSHKRTIAGEIDGRSGDICIDSTRRHVEADERLPRARHSCHKADQLPLRPLRLGDKFLKML
jgi:hypothetical protein